LIPGVLFKKSMYSSYIPTHLRRYVLDAHGIHGLQDPQVQAYMKYKKVNFCDLHLEDALKHGYQRLVKYYVNSGVLQQSTTFFNNLDPIDFKKRVRMWRKDLSFPPFYEYGYILPFFYDTDQKVTTRDRGVSITAELERSSCDDDSPNLFVWQLALQMAVRYASVHVCDVIRLKIRRIVSNSKYLDVCYNAARQAAFRGCKSLLRKLLRLDLNNPHIGKLYADACTPNFMEEICEILGKANPWPVSTGAHAIEVIDAAIFRRDVDIYRKITTFPWIQKIDFINGILTTHTTLESFLAERAACLGFYEVVDMPWLYDEFPPEIDFDSRPNVISAAIFGRNGGRTLKYIVEHPSGKSLARSGKLAEWVIDHGNCDVAIWLIKQGYPPRELDREDLLLLWREAQEFSSSAVLDEIVELCTLLGVEMK